MRERLSIPVLLGTAREGRRSAAVATLAVKELEQFGAATTLIDVRDLCPVGRSCRPADVDPAVVRPWKDAVATADGLVIVTPEYNHSFPGELKLALDSLLDEYLHLTVGLVVTSSGGLGGAHLIGSLVPTLTKVGMVPTKTVVHTSNLASLFDDADRLKRYRTRLQALFQEVADRAAALRPLRREAIQSVP